MTGYRVVGRVRGDGHLERERDRDREGRELGKDWAGGHIAVGVSKSLSGPGASGSPQFSSGGQSRSSSRRGKGRRVSISGGSIPSFGAKTRDDEPRLEPELAAGQRSMRTDVGEKRNERLTEERERLQEEDGGMSVDGSGRGDGERDSKRQSEREAENDLEREEETDKDMERDQKEAKR